MFYFIIGVSMKITDKVYLVGVQALDILLLVIVIST